jgi:hypothetical protein
MSILTKSQIAGYAQGAGLSGSALQIATAIALAESGGDTAVINPGHSGDVEYSVGLWQINLLAHPQYTVMQMQDPLQNARAMFAISNGGKNWIPWGTYTSGRYLQFMGSVTPTPVLSSPSTIRLTSSTSGGSSSISSLTSSVRTNPATVSDVGSGWSYILAYTVVILIFAFISHFEAGYSFLYYLAVLFFILLLVTQARFIQVSLEPITGFFGQNEPPVTELSSTLPSQGGVILL